MKYLSQLDDLQILELIRLYIGNEVVVEKFVVERGSAQYFVNLETTDVLEGYLEDSFYMTDYACDPVDYLEHNPWLYTLKYRRLMLKWFGDSYAFDHLLSYESRTNKEEVVS